MTTPSMHHTCLQECTPQRRAEDTLASVLAMQWDRTPAMILDSPPGAGKTGVAVRIAGMSMAMMKERCVLITQTNAQAMDVTERLCTRYPTRTIHLFVRKGLELPSTLSSKHNLVVVHSDKDLPLEPSIVVGNAAKWSWSREEVEPFDLMIIDEAYQLPDFRFWQIANLAERVILIGDPGQIEPVITSDVRRWSAHRAAPHRPCPETLLEHFPDIPIIKLPVSRRLRASTVRLVQPAFYPQLAFDAFDEPDTRALLLDDIDTFAPPVRHALARLEAGESMAGVMLPKKLTGEHDPELSELIAQTARCLTGSLIEDMGEVRELHPSDIGIACSHRSQVQAVREHLGADMHDVLVETADRFQGLERKVMLVHHPLSGRGDASAFHLDVGRLCVMLSRHRIACLVFWREGILELLDSAPMSGERVLGDAEDGEYSGRCAHKAVLCELKGEA